jgi:hypothetical protein
MTPKERVELIFKRCLANGFNNVLEEMERGITEAVLDERQALAETAWKMQVESFGGGTAIGNAIAEGIHLKR